MGIQFSGLASGLDTTSIVADLMDAEYTRVEKVEKELTKKEWEKDIWSDLNTELYSFYKEELFTFKTRGSYDTKTLSSSNEEAVKLTSAASTMAGSHTIDVTQMAKASFLTGDEMDATITDESTVSDLIGIGADDTVKLYIKTGIGEVGSEDNEISITGSDTIKSIMSKINGLDADITANYDTNFNRVFMSSTETGADVQLAITGEGDTLSGNAQLLMEKLGFAGGAVGTEGLNAKFIYNNTELENSSNNVTVNGLGMSLRAEGEATLSANVDTQAIYDQVKSFITKYNELSQSMITKYDADSASDYAPLTADEKEAMTDDEVEEWETTIKNSLLRSDDKLYSLTSSMRSVLTTSTGVDTTDFTYKFLSDIGISTGNYSENGLLHIKGDSDDSTYSNDENLLMQAIEEDPDAVMELLSAVGDKLYTNMQTSMQATSLSSSLTFYNNKKIDDEIEDYEDDIDNLEDYMDDLEDRYYSQFTAMELAISKSNSTADWLSQQLSGL